MKSGTYKQAVLWERLDNDRVRCLLCGHRCTIAAGMTGLCFVRKNIGGELFSLNYDQVCAANVDPIEKKPLFHFQPGSRSYSVAAVGCNFRCSFCQNWQISQIQEGVAYGSPLPPEKIVAEAIKSRSSSIAYTYTEPTVFMELAAETGRLAREKGLKNVFVSNGYLTAEAVDYCRDFLDGINIDLKAFTDDFYKKLCKAHLQPVLDTIKYIAQKTDIWLELTTLVVPGQNSGLDELENIARFIADEVSVEVPWHVSRFYPTYQMTDNVPTGTDVLEAALKIGKRAGLKYVYVGNLPGNEAESTFCPDCGSKIIHRIGYQIIENRIENGRCPDCQAAISGVY